MIDRLLHFGLHTCAVTLILASAILATTLGYGGFLRLLGSDPIRGAVFIVAGIGMGVGAYLLCVHKRDLTYG